ncbi:hypothetical protein AGABI2DRAFT_119833 [Agaricus bisporus var. bisporus H97]|uniref:hypothetical protein n=1 Tax=Agaricus bisporus var. bisporus (strain H97 / ATCC MYA-4626 / FGSC 10389) TaxID=936046 RepID=UPI00029F6968|nr:hypothetical protein AGABI2DRAFT_119833 [Agaricus bisporus var. bisporus H97]EKV44873.1 hypothetical protein AGABI2DRAFT_119833 [Agaricus bisporus var. bisporus H97]
MVLLIIRPSNPFGVDGDVEYADPGEGNLKAMDRTIFETPPTNIDIVKARIMVISYGAQSEYNVMVASWFFSKFSNACSPSTWRKTASFSHPLLRSSFAPYFHDGGSSRYIPSHVDAIENIEDYQPGGYHPIYVDDTFDHGRFRILHKLGFGGSSTVWLARDQREGGERSTLVALKAMRADVSSSKAPSEIPEPAISQKFESLSLLPTLSSSIISSYKAQTVPIYSSYSLLLAPEGRATNNDDDPPHALHWRDLTTSNILFRLLPHAIKWSDAEVYAHLGAPETDIEQTRSGQPFDILRQIVETLGRLPDPWWATFEQRALWFEEDGQSKNEQDQEDAGVLLQAYRSSIRAKLLEVGERDDPPSEHEGPMIEKPWVRLLEEEVGLLENLLEKMLKYIPEERLRIQNVIRHPWFT